MNKAVALQIITGKVLCPKYEEDVSYDEACRECLFMRSRRASGETSDEGADGIILCEFIPIKEE